MNNKKNAKIWLQQVLWFYAELISSQCHWCFFFGAFFDWFCTLSCVLVWHHQSAFDITGRISAALSFAYMSQKKSISGFHFCHQWCFLVTGWEWTLDNVLQHLHKGWSIGLTPFVILGGKLGKINWQVKEVSNLMLYAQSTSTAIWGQWQVKEIKL